MTTMLLFYTLKPDLCYCLQSSASATDTDIAVGEEAASLLDSICDLFHSGVAKYTDGQRYEKLRYDMLISCVDGALPKQNAAMVSCLLNSVNAYLYTYG